MKTPIFIAAIYISFIAVGCSTTTYLNITEMSEEQIEDKIIVFQKEEAIGAEVTLLLGDGKKINGELLSVRDSNIIMCSEYAATEKELASLQYPIHTIRIDEILEITLEGTNYRWIGYGIGAVVGLGLAALVAESVTSQSTKGDMEEGFGNACGAGLLGIGIVALVTYIGGFWGTSASTDDVTFNEIPPDYKLLPLNPLCRYPNEEPEYLKAIK